MFEVLVTSRGRVTIKIPVYKNYVDLYFETLWSEPRDRITRVIPRISESLHTHSITHYGLVRNRRSLQTCDLVNHRSAPPSCQARDSRISLPPRVSHDDHHSTANLHSQTFFWKAGLSSFHRPSVTKPNYGQR